MASVAPVLITRATGFIGGHLVRALVARGVRVRCLIRVTDTHRNFEHLPIECVAGDVRDPDTLRPAVAGCEVLYHLAADIRDPYDVNVEGTRNVLHVARESSCRRIVFCSSAEMLGSTRDQSSADETHPTTLADMRGQFLRSKFLADQEALRAAAGGAPVVIVNPTAVVGPGDARPSETGRMIMRLLNRRFPIYLDAAMNVVAVEDVAQGHILAAERGKVGERYILGNRNLTVREIVQMLSELTGRPGWRVRLPLGRKLIYNPAKAIRELGLPQTSIKNALARAICWFCNHGYVNGTHGDRLRLAPGALEAMTTAPHPIEGPR